MRLAPLLAGLGLLAIATASATAPSDWQTPTAGVQVPPCTTQTNINHYEVLVDESTASRTMIYDGFKAQGYHNLGVKYVGGIGAVFYGDCALAN